MHGAPGAGASLIGASIVVGGWVKTGRVAEKGALCFLELNDGSGPVNLQCVVKADVHDIDALKATGTCVVLEGEVRAPPEGATQVVEVHASRILHVGPCDAAKYPIAKKKITLEFLRTKIHLRTRTNTIAAIARNADDVDLIIPQLDDRRAGVRRAAVEAVAAMGRRTGDQAKAKAALEARLAAETDAKTIARLKKAIGTL